MASLTRRTFLNRGAQLPVAGAAAWILSACGAKPGASAGKGGVNCVDAGQLTAAQTAQRASFHYADTSPDPQKTCSGCAFFTPPESGTGCGQCQVLLAPANPGGHCDSWAAKAG
jgi:hypothetical protein